MVLPPVVVLAGGVVPVLGGVPLAGVVPGGQDPLVVVLVVEVVPLAPLLPAGLPGLAAVPAPVPVVLEGTQVTGEMPVGFGLPIAPLVAAGGVEVPGAGVTPPGVCVTG